MFFIYLNFKVQQHYSFGWQYPLRAPCPVLGTKSTIALKANIKDFETEDLTEMAVLILGLVQSLD